MPKLKNSNATFWVNFKHCDPKYCSSNALKPPLTEGIQSIALLDPIYFSKHYAKCKSLVAAWRMLRLVVLSCGNFLRVDLTYLIS